MQAEAQIREGEQAPLLHPEDCPLCYEPLLGDEDVKLVCSSHRFHRQCYTDLVNHCRLQQMPLNCPMCRWPDL